jgi:hypothetical protein
VSEDRWPCSPGLPPATPYIRPHAEGDRVGAPQAGEVLHTTPQAISPKLNDSELVVPPGRSVVHERMPERSQRVLSRSMLSCRAEGVGNGQSNESKRLVRKPTHHVESSCLKFRTQWLEKEKPLTAGRDDGGKERRSAGWSCCLCEVQTKVSRTHSTGFQAQSPCRRR